MFDISVLAAERRGQGHRRRGQAGVLAGEKGAQEIAVTLRGDRDPVARRQADGQQAAGQFAGLFSQGGVGENLDQFAAK